MNRLLLPEFFLAVFAPWVALAQSQDPVPGPPTPPFVAPMPDNSTWSIKVTSQASSAKLPPGARLVSQLIATKSGTAREIVSVWTDGSRSQLWFWQGYRLEEGPGSKAVLVTKLPGGHDWQNADFLDLNWLGISNYVGLEDQNGHECYLFKTEIKLERFSVYYAADIDTKTKRPVRWSVGPNHFELVDFEQRKTPEPLVLPEAFADQLKAYRLAAGAAQPYLKP
jgi:hypothetical protein